MGGNFGELALENTEVVVAVGDTGPEKVDVVDIDMELEMLGNCWHTSWNWGHLNIYSDRCVDVGLNCS